MSELSAKCGVCMLMNTLRIVLIALILQNSEPKVLEKVSPVYPSLARMARIEGNVQLSVSVGPDGRVTEVKVVNASNPVLVTNAVDAARQWIFQTTPKGGEVRIDMPFSLSLETRSGDVITGRILSTAGDPISNIVVSAMQFNYSKGRRSLNAIGSAKTDDRGVYRIMRPGSGNYILVAHYSPPANSAPGIHEDYAADTYYPGTTSLESISPVIVRSGEETTANFNIQATNHGKISGKILPAISGPLPHYSISRLYLVPHTTNVTDFAPIIQEVKIGDGDLSGFPYEIHNVPNGSYYLVAMFRDENTYYMGRTIVNVGAQSIDGITLSIHPVVDLKGKIVFTAKPTDFQLTSVHLDFGPKENHGPLPVLARITPSVFANTDGTFSFVSLPEGRYGITSITGLPLDTYISDIRMGGYRIYDDGIFTIGDFPPAEIQVTVAGNGSTLSGLVHDSMQRPVGRAVVTLVPDAPRRENSFLYKRVISNSDGTFTLRGIAPGDYKIFAWEKLLSTAEENPEFLAEFEQRGVKVNINQGGTLPRVSLTVIPAKP